MYILRDSFLRAWYSAYNFEDNKVGIVRTFNSTAQVIRRHLPTWVIVIIVLGVLLVVAAIGIAVCMHRKKKK